MSPTKSAAEIATRFLDGIADRDLDAMRAVTAETAGFWTNIAQVDMDRDTRFERIAAEFRVFESFRFEQARIGDFGDGFVVRALASGSLPGGVRFEFPICIVGDVADGRIVRFEEYLDASAVAPIFASLASDENG
jgi:ketosteroid isomerase-like protein